MKIRSLFLFSNSFVTLFFFSFPAHGIQNIHFVTSKPEIMEVLTSYYPGKPSSPSLEKEVVMPSMRGLTGFGGLTTKIDDKKARPWCGPSPRTNTLNCFNFNRHGTYIGSFPVPGKISSTPIFYDNSWLIGTAKGYLIRVEADIENKYLPKLTHENINLWGSSSRNVMSNYKQKTIYSENSSSQYQTSQSEKPETPYGVKWIFPASSSFTGTPVIKNGFVYIFAASQYFQAFNWNTGKLEWAIRLAPSSNLRIDSNAFVVTDSEVLVGNSLGSLIALNPNTGGVLWSWEVPQATQNQRALNHLSAGPDKFYGIVASPYIFEKQIIVSNAESMTQAISLESHEAIWSYPEGSVAQAKSYQNNILIGTSSGKVSSLDHKTGVVKWAKSLTNKSPIISLYVTKNNLLLAATRRGKIFMIDPETGVVLAQNNDIGEVNGEFFTGFHRAEACLNFAANGFRCFRAKL